MSSIIDVLPFEIISRIIDIIAKQDRVKNQNTKGRFKSLKACSLTCQGLLPLCRAYIFHSIEFRDSSNLQGRSVTPHFIKLITNTPKIAHYIRELRYGMQSGVEFPLLAAALDHITKLQSLSLYFKGITGGWSDGWMNPTTRSSLLRVMHLPTIVSLELRNMGRFNPEWFIPCINLKSLYLEYFHLEEDHKISPEVLKANPCDKLIHLETTNLAYKTIHSVLAMQGYTWADGSPMLGLGELKEVNLELSDNDDLTWALEMMPRTRCVEILKFTVVSRVVNSLSAFSLISPTLTKLKSLSLVIDHNVHDSASHPYVGMCQVLDWIAGKNIIELIKLHIMLFKYEYTTGDEWKELEHVLTSPGWPSLHLVDLHIVVVRSAEIVEQMKTLRDTQLSELLSNSLFKFNFKVSRTFSDDYGLRI